MPEKEKATTLHSSAKKGARKLHQSAWALLPCMNKRPGAPRRPQIRVSIPAPSESTMTRSGACSTALWNHAGAGGTSPWNSARGAISR